MSRFSRSSRSALSRATRGLPFDPSSLQPTSGRGGAFSGGTRAAFRVTTEGMDEAIATLTRIGALATFESERIIGEESETGAAAIAAKWPVDTGLSKSRWVAHRQRRGKRWAWVISNDVPYAKYVHRKGNPVPLFESLVPVEIGKTRDRIARRFRALLRDRAPSFRDAGVSLRRTARAFYR